MEALRKENLQYKQDITKLNQEVDSLLSDLDIRGNVSITRFTFLKLTSRVRFSSKSDSLTIRSRPQTMKQL